MGKSSCCSKEGLNRGAWTAEEDKILRDYISVHGEGKWRKLPERAGLKRCGKSCRLRWLNYLRPDIKRGNISQDEEDLIIRLHKLLGNRWSLIAGRLPGRTDNEIKNYWNTNLGKKVRDRHTTGAEKNIQKTKAHEPTLEATPSPSSLSPSKQERVFLTKASKCSKSLFVDPVPPQSSMPSLQNESNNAPELEADPAEEPLLLVDDGAANVSGSNNMLLENRVYDNDLLSFPSEDQRELPTDLAFDFGSGEVCLSGLLNSDFSSGMCDLGYNNYSGSEELLPFWDKPLLSSHEILKEYRTQSNFCDEMNGANSYFHPFSPFL